MLIEVRDRSQITIPSELVKKMGIRKGDKFEVIEREDGILLCPVVVYPKEKIEKIKEILKSSKETVKNQNGFDSVEEMFKDMGIDLD